MTSTPRLALPFIAPGQAQKEFFHNEALQALDALVAAAVEGVPQNAPPASPSVGQCFLVGSAPTGAFAGKAGHVAAFGAGGWRFHAPVEGMSVAVKPSGVTADYRAGAWDVGSLRGDRLVVGGQQVVGARAAAIASPSGGATVDGAARGAIDQILAALRLHGLIAT